MRPLFVFGSERSGTTFLGSLLGSNSLCVATPESHFVTEVYRSWQAANKEGDLEDATRRIQRHFRFQLWNLDLDFQEVAQQGLQTYPELILHLVNLYSQAVGRSQAQVWVDHTPTNNRSATTLLKLFPEAKFIHIVRDGRAVAASIKNLKWENRNMLVLSRVWADKIGYGVAVESCLGPSKCIRVKYEELLQDTEGVLQTICSFADLSFEQEMITGRGFALPEYTVKQHALVGKRPEPSRINAWEKNLTEREIELFEFRSFDLLDYLGYRTKYGVKARHASRRERLSLLLRDLAWHKPLDRLEERRKRRRAIEQLRAQGYLNRRP